MTTAKKKPAAAKGIKPSPNPVETAKSGKKPGKQASTTRSEAKKEEAEGKDSTVSAAKKPPSRKKIGRPSKYTQDLADEICQRIREGEPVRQICLLEHMPPQAVFYRWLQDKPDFREQYARAKEDQAETFAEELIDIADNSTNDWVERENQRGELYTAFNDEAVSRAKLRIEARKWLMGKMKPKKYGEKTLIGSDPDNPLSVGVAIVPAKNPA